MIKNFINNLNENKFFIGCMMMFVTIGGRFIITELSESQKNFIHNEYVRKIFIFCAFFMATRDICCSLTLTILFLLIISGLFNGDDIIFNNKQEKQEINNKDKQIDSMINELNNLKNVL